MNPGPSEHQSGFTSTDFDSLVLQSSLPTMVIFENPWSMALMPGLDQLATAFTGDLRLVRVDLATHLELAARLKIRVVPTLLFFKGGALVEFMVGPVPTQFIVEMVANTHLRRRSSCKERLAVLGANQLTERWPVYHPARHLARLCDDPEISKSAAVTSATSSSVSPPSTTGARLFGARHVDEWR